MPPPASSAAPAWVQHRSGRLGVWLRKAPTAGVRGPASIGKFDPRSEASRRDLEATGASAHVMAMRPEQHRVKRLLILVGGGDRHEVKLDPGRISGKPADVRRSDLSPSQDQLERDDARQRPVRRTGPHRRTVPTPLLRRRGRRRLERSHSSRGRQSSTI